MILIIETKFSILFNILMKNDQTILIFFFQMINEIKKKFLFFRLRVIFAGFFLMICYMSEIYLEFVLPNQIRTTYLIDPFARKRKTIEGREIKESEDI